MPSRRSFLKSSSLAALASGFSSTASRAASPSPGVSFFLVGDTHYSADETERGAMMVRSLETNGRLLDWLNKLPGSPLPDVLGGGSLEIPSGVIHAGDLVDNGDKGPGKFHLAELEFAAFAEDWGLNGGDGKLKWPLREIHGNHDSPHGDGPVISELKNRNRKRSGLKNRSANDLHYSWDWGNVHFVALGLIVGTDPGIQRKRRYAAMESLEFLRRDLEENVGRSGRPVVLVHHVDVARYSREVTEQVAMKNEWDFGDVRAFYETIKPYNIAATMYGHTHVRNLFRWNGSPDAKAQAGIPSINTDNAGHFKSATQGFLHLSLTDKELVVREFATKDAWRTGEWTPQKWSFALTKN
jgi:hypothetical protein